MYQSGENVEQQKEQLMYGCRIVINKVRVNNSTKRKFVGSLWKSDWAGILEYEKVALLPIDSKRPSLKVLDVKCVEHKRRGWRCLQS